MFCGICGTERDFIEAVRVRRIDMVRHVDGCVGCPRDAIGCIRGACPKEDEIEMICDLCGDYADDLYEVHGQQLCAACVLKQFKKVEEE